MYASLVTAAAWHRGYRTTIEVGLVLALLAVLGLFHLPLRMQDDVLLSTAAQETVQLEDIQQTLQPEQAPPPPRALTPVAVPDESLPDEVPLDLDASLDLNQPIAAPGPPPPPPPADDADENADETEIFVVVEEMPELIGGMSRLYELVQYPEMAAKAGLEGMVIVQFVVNKEGVPTDLIVRRSAGGLLDGAAVEAIKQLRFTPGRQRGNPVNVRFSIPVRFQLSMGNAR